MNDDIGLAEALLGLPGFRVLDVTETDSEVGMTIETTAVRVACRTGWVRAEAEDRMRVDVRDLACFGRPARLVWSKRRWRCHEPLCPARTWTEASEPVDAQAVLTGVQVRGPGGGGPVDAGRSGLSRWRVGSRSWSTRRRAA